MLTYSGTFDVNQILSEHNLEVFESFRDTSQLDNESMIECQSVVQNYKNIVLKGKYFPFHVLFPQYE